MFKITQRLTSLLLLLVVAGVLSNRPPASAVAANPSVDPLSVAAFEAPPDYIVHGVHLSPVPDSYAGEISAFEKDVVQAVGIVMYFRVWDQHAKDANGVGPCDNGHLPRSVDVGEPPAPGAPGGRVIMLTWQPLPILANPGPADYDNVLSGQYDSLIDTCAEELKAWSNKTFMVRLMHEMNISDSAYWAGHSYNQKPDGTGDTEKFRQVWRYIWNRFDARGVNNVQWVWSPNYASNPGVAWNNLHNYYPGDQYVDWIGLSGYNWMGTVPFISFTTLFDSVLTDLQCRYAKPIAIAEIGSAPYSDGPPTLPNKASWIEDAYEQVQKYPLVRAIVWFNDFAFHNVDAADFRVWTNTDFAYSRSPDPVDPAATAAYASAVADNAFTPDFTTADLLNPPIARCPGDAVSDNGVLSAIPASGMIGRTGATTTHFNIGALGLSQDTQFTVTCPTGFVCEFASSGDDASTLEAPWSSDTLVVTASPGTPLGPAVLTIAGGAPPMEIQIQVTVVAKMLRQYLPLVRR